MNFLSYPWYEHKLQCYCTFPAFYGLSVPGIDNFGNIFFFFLENIQRLGDFLLENLGYQVLASTANVFHCSSVREDFRVVKAKSFLVNEILPIKEILLVW